MGKQLNVQGHQPGVYRDDPDRDDAASTSSAVLLDHIDYSNAELPAYSDEPNQIAPSGQFPSAPTSSNMTWYSPPPALPFSTHDIDYTEIRTRFPDYSTDAETLLKMIQVQAKYPPSYFVELRGTHTESSRTGNKKTKNSVVDFSIRINITHLLTRAIGSGDETIELLPDNKRGYRGGRVPGLKPTVSISDIENQTDAIDELKLWCEAYVNNPASVKSFTLKREVINHDTARLEQLLRSAIAETKYQGHLQIKFPIQHKRLVVYSPGRINEWRITTWIRWVFYLTFLWIFAWPILFFLTHKYETVKVIYSYANVPISDGGNRRCTVMNEHEWFKMWEIAIQRAAVAKMVCHERCLDDDYRIATAQMDARSLAQSLIPVEAPRTGNAFADGALGLLSQGLRVAEAWNGNGGWGADS